jgi:hypothetical protein
MPTDLRELYEDPDVVSSVALDHFQAIRGPRGGTGHQPAKWLARKTPSRKTTWITGPPTGLDDSQVGSL